MERCGPRRAGPHHCEIGIRKAAVKHRRRSIVLNQNLAGFGHSGVGRTLEFANVEFLHLQHRLHGLRDV